MSFDKKAIKRLIDEIDSYDETYYNENRRLVSDKDYDFKKDALRRLGKDFQPTPGSKADSKLAIRLNDALTRVGAPPPKDGKWPKVSHEVPMGSLNKVNTPDELSAWQSKCEDTSPLFVTEKLDGISVSLKYEKGVLVLGATRGDGDIGEDITRNVKKMKGVPRQLRKEFTGYVRGEILLFKSDWKTHFPDKANPRNAASGIAKRINGHGVEHLTVVCYTVEGVDFKTEYEAFCYLQKLGFKTSNFQVVHINRAKELWQIYMDSFRDKLDYDIDGFVVRINDRAAQFALGEENHRPKGAIAFKFEALEDETVIRKITCQVGDTGHITPVAEFDEIELGGARVKRASLHNFSLIRDLGIDVGAKVIVERANDVIPYVKDVISSPGIYLPPQECPACKTKTQRVGEYVVCPNKKDCSPQVLGRLNKWIKELGILEWGESILTKLTNADLVKDVADLYKLSANDISQLDRMGEKSAKNLITELDKFREIPLENFLGGLCIEGIATSTSKSIINEGFDTMDDILSITVSQLKGIPGFAEKRAKAFYKGLRENRSRIQDILNAGVKIKARVKGLFTGKSFCFTGTMSTPRAKLQKMVEENGGEVKKSVGKNLDYLVISDPNSTSSKAKAARKNNTTLLSEQDFLLMIK